MPHTEAIVVKLMSPTRSKAQWLEHTAQAFQRAVQLGLDAAQSQHTSRRALLHKVAYRAIREQFGLPSEFARMAVNAAVALARSFDRLRRSGRHGAFPHVQRSQGIGLGIHAYKVIQDGDRFVLRVSTGEQRQFMWFPLCVPARYQEKMPMVRGDARLFRRKGDWYAMLPLRLPPSPGRP